MTTELELSPADIKASMIAFLLELGYTHPEETEPGIPNPHVTVRESGPKNVTYDLYSFPSARQPTAAIVITNSDNDVVIVNFRTGDSDAVHSRYFEVNNIHDRQHAKDFLTKHSR